jgi:hypothetical protein
MKTNSSAEYRRIAERERIPSPIAMRTFGDRFYGTTRNTSRADYYRELAERWVSMRFGRLLLRNVRGDSCKIFKARFAPILTTVRMRGPDQSLEGELSQVMARAFYMRDVARGWASYHERTEAALPVGRFAPWCNPGEEERHGVLASAILAGKNLLIYDPATLCEDQKGAVHSLFRQFRISADLERPPLSDDAFNENLPPIVTLESGRAEIEWRPTDAEPERPERVEIMREASDRVAGLMLAAMNTHPAALHSPKPAGLCVVGRADDPQRGVGHAEKVKAMTWAEWRASKVRHPLRQPHS